MVDYRKFDNIVDSDEDEEFQQRVTPQRPAQFSEEIVSDHSASTTTVASDVGLVDSKPPPPTMMTSKGKSGRYRFEHEGRLVYEWEQNLTETIIYIPLPPQVTTKKQLAISIKPTHLVVGIKDLPPYIDEDTGGTVIVDESMWMLDEGELIINLQKMNKAEAWDCALKGRAGQHAASSIDPVTKEELKKQLMRERFQEEHPGFDFSQADFNGTVPDARDFMGGVKHF